MPSAGREFAGTLNVPLTLEAPSETVVSQHGTPDWPIQATVWGRMEGLGGTNGGALVADAAYRFRLRYRSDVKPQWRVGLVGTNRKFPIVAVQDPDGRRRELVILAQEKI